MTTDLRTTTGQYLKKKKTSTSIANCYTQNSYCILYLNLILQIINILEGNIDKRSSKMGQWVNAEDLSFSPGIHVKVERENLPSCLLHVHCNKRAAHTHTHMIKPKACF